MKKLILLLLLLGVNSASALSIKNFLDTESVLVYTWKSGHYCLLSNQKDDVEVKPHSQAFNVQLAETEPDRDCFTKAHRLYFSWHPSIAGFCLRSETDTDITNKRYIIHRQYSYQECEEEQGKNVASRESSNKISAGTANRLSVKPLLIGNYLDDSIYVSIEGAKDFCMLSNNDSTFELKPHSEAFVQPAETSVDEACFMKARKLWVVKIKQPRKFETIGSCINSEVETDLQHRVFLVLSSGKTDYCMAK